MKNKRSLLDLISPEKNAAISKTIRKHIYKKKNIAAMTNIIPKPNLKPIRANSGVVSLEYRHFNKFLVKKSFIESTKKLLYVFIYIL